MTLRLSTLFETHIKTIIYDWKSAKRKGKIRSSSRRHLKKTKNVAPKTKNLTNKNASTTKLNESEENGVKKSSTQENVENNPQPSTSMIGQPSTSYFRRGTSRLGTNENNFQNKSEASTFSSDSDEPAVSVKERPRRSTRKKSLATSTNDFHVSLSPKHEKSNHQMIKQLKHKTRLQRSRLPVNESSEEQSDVQDEETGETSMAEVDASSVASDSSSDSDNSTDDEKPLVRIRESNGLITKNTSPSKSLTVQNKRSRRNLADSDKSHTLNHTNHSGSGESEAGHTRPKRGNLHQTRHPWNQSYGNLDQSRNNDEPLSRLRTRRRIEPSESDNSLEESSISKRSSTHRTTRSTRPIISEAVRNSSSGINNRTSRSRSDGKYIQRIKHRVTARI